MIADGRHHYSIDGVLNISSAVTLPELQFFKVQAVERADLTIRVAAVGGFGPRLRSHLHVSGRHVLYREHLGSLFANFSIDVGDPVDVVAAPMLALSPHVLYTNVVEPLLRFMLVDRGYMLLHAACIQIDGHSIILSAQTDTGKTSTILSLLRRHEGTFYSDDMLVVTRHGMARRYPKPLTISAHTLHAVPQNRLKLHQRLSLSWQSRLHSRGGRAVGKRMGERNLPIMAMNAAVQMMVPPPKYMVTELVDCRIGNEIPIQDIYLIERGRPSHVAPVDRSDALRELLLNTEDAYGFPPYAELAPRLVIGGRDHAQLRHEEASILASALEWAEITRIRVDDFSWPELIQARRRPEPALPAGLPAQLDPGRVQIASGPR